MSDLDSLKELHAKLKGTVDAALEAMPEYRQMRALEEVIVKLETPAAQIGALAAKAKSATDSAQHTVQGMAATVIRNAGEPQSLQRIFEHIDGIKKYGDKKKARVNMVSVLSKGKMLKAVMWKGSHAWWFADKPLPRESAGVTT